MIFLILFCQFLILPNSWNDYKFNKKGIKAYDESNYEEAKQSFLNVKENNISYFNLGDASYKSNDFNSSNFYFNKASELLNEDSKIKSLFNLGNSYFKSNNILQSLLSYQKALELCNKDGKFCDEISKEIRNNMEHVYTLNDNSKDNQDNKDNDKNKDKDDSENKEKEKEKESDQGNKKDKDKNRDSKDNQNTKEDNKQIPKEQAEQIINMINKLDTELQKKVFKDKFNKPFNGKEW